MMQDRLVGFSKALAAISTVLALSSCAGGGGGGSNSLDIGYGSKAPEKIKIDMKGLMNYTGKSVDELNAMRAKTVAEHPELLKSSPYKPNPEVFSFDGKSPWWGMKGYIFRGKEGVTNTDGQSRESAYFGNPFLLVCPEIYGSGMHWATNRFPKDTDFANVFPCYVPPASVTFYPKEKREEITFDVMKWYNDVRSMQDNDWPVSQVTFDIHAYNARDFGFNYIYVDADASKNLSKMPADVMAIDQSLVLRSRNTCAEHCNDYTTPDELTGFKIKNVPAKCSLKLWQAKPTNHLSSPDLKVDLVFN